MAESNIPPASAEELRAAILVRYESLSKRLQQIARYVLDEPNAMALETLAVLAERTGVQPSAIVRFAKSFGFDGATQMQRLFRDARRHCPAQFEITEGHADNRLVVDFQGQQSLIIQRVHGHP